MSAPNDNLAKIIQDLNSKFKVNGKVEGTNRATIIVDKSQILEIANYLKQIGFDHVKAVTGIDYPETEEFEVVYHISSYSDLALAKVIVALREKTSYKDPVFPSLFKVWESVWTGERETYEMLGIVFEGHPELRRMFLDEDFEGVYPLRKSYKLKQEGVFVDKPA
ncbi:NADH-quinone oxidoreductase subunit C [Sulfolobus acidocaldarius]|uniref:NADH dehydrogenase I chain C n=4 Tax=Sulfolobus acidocaldarius TaxID=2285 RepID=Q4J6F3_SULAC|nr:NADH-quinone oxidoreductase subunit C [Sulfolobus acidocaldarius]AAY81627.1 NADH dehydrogenase I chain C [Sulfolobus acidocaldarius DSM 639]ALU30597.1 NADH dehydrogenase [Sulfolobus acidocaldarius]ALU32858.1 NADH dehydrogenase [Sulfolobus acidocaldarius]